MANNSSGAVPSPRSIKGMLAKARLGRSDKSPSASLDDLNVSLARESSDTVVGRIRTHTRRSIDEGSLSSGGKLSSLIPKKIKSRSRRRKEMEDEGVERGRSTGGHTNGQDSPSSVTLDQNDPDDSMMTTDSEEEANTTDRPQPTTRESHAGYLTSSSPIIKATAISTDNLAPVSDHFNYSSTSTFPINPAQPRTVSNLARGSNGNGIARNESTLSVNSFGSARSSSRSVSPGRRLKDAFIPTKSLREEDAPSRLSFSGGTTPTFGGFFSKDRGSLSSRRSVHEIKEFSRRPLSIESLNKPSVSSVSIAPAIVTTPTTPPLSPAPVMSVTPPTPGDKSEFPRLPSTAPLNSPTAASGLPALTHRRARSDSASHQPSKLSQAMSAPLTPMIEEKTPGVRNASGNSVTSQGGFFSSVFSVAQNAANTITSTINTGANAMQRPRSSTQTTTIEEEKPRDIFPSSEILGEKAAEAKALAIDTIGNGDLSLSHLGISIDSKSIKSLGDSPASTRPDLGLGRTRSGTVIHRHEAAARAEDVSAARAVSQAYDPPIMDDVSTLVADDTNPNASRSSVAAMSGDKSPPNGSLFESEGSVWRSNSLRNKVGRAKRRNRNGSGATGSAIGAAITASHRTFTNPVGVAEAKPYERATRKRDRDFHQLFRSVPEDDSLIEDYSCALQRDIILAGRIYVSEHHVCFSSNILGWVTTLVISFDEVVSIEKETTAMVFPNAIAIQTLHARHTFRSLLSRETTYDLLIGIWKTNHPSLQSSENGIKITSGTGSKTEKIDIVESDEESGSDGQDIASGSDENDEEDGEDDGTASVAEDGNGKTHEDSDKAESPSKAAALRKPSAMAPAATLDGAAQNKPTEVTIGAASAAADFPGPATHAPTECTDIPSHYERVLKDEVIPAPLGKVYSMIFGPGSVAFMSKWLQEEVKVTQMDMEDDPRGLSAAGKSRLYQYVKPLYASIGPKQCTCIITEQLDFFDLEKSVSVSSTTQTPDVPSGNVFNTKTKYCLMWGPNNSTRIIITCMIEWTGKSWLKGPIEKGSNEGQAIYANDLVKHIRASVTSRTRVGTAVSKGKKLRKKKGDSSASPDMSSSNASIKPADWGLFEPLHGPLGPVVDIVWPLFSAKTMVGFLLFLLTISWFRNSRLRASGSTFKGLEEHRRMLAYEALWQNEESTLWDWLEGRVGDGVPIPAVLRKDIPSKSAKNNRQSKDYSSLAQTLSEKEIEWALSVTEEKLGVLRSLLGNSRDEVAGGKIKKQAP